MAIPLPELSTVTAMITTTLTPFMPFIGLVIAISMAGLILSLVVGVFTR